MPRRALTRLEMFKLATLFQGGLLLVGLVIAWLAGIDLAALTRWSTSDAMFGVLATLPMVLVFFASEMIDWNPLERIRDFLHNVLGPTIVRCTFLDLLYLSFLAGLSEEILFRGAIQNSLFFLGTAGAVIATNLLFGICHAFSLAYFVLAAGFGFYLSWVAGVQEQNLLPAVIAHTLYDFVALCVVRHDAIKERAGKEDDDSDSPAGQTSQNERSPKSDETEPETAASSSEETGAEEPRPESSSPGPPNS